MIYLRVVRYNIYLHTSRSVPSLFLDLLPSLELLVHANFIAVALVLAKHRQVHILSATSVLSKRTEEEVLHIAPKCRRGNNCEHVLVQRDQDTSAVVAHVDGDQIVHHILHASFLHIET